MCVYLQTVLERRLLHSEGEHGAFEGVSLQVGCYLIAATSKSPKACVQAVSKVVLIDAQGYIDGLGPAAKGPTWLTKLGVRFLRTVFLRSIANKTAYFDAKLATDDAMRIGRVHTFEPGWLEAKVAFIKSGGYKGLSRRVRDISQQVLLMWGRQDKVLDVKYVKEFERDLKHVDTLLIDECGHMAHLEQSKACADAILNFTGK